jgi:hypothetical protein
MLRPEDLSGAFADDAQGAMVLPRRHARHDGSIGDTQVFDFQHHSAGFHVAQEAFVPVVEDHLKNSSSALLFGGLPGHS